MSPLSGPALLRALNGTDHDLRFLQARRVDPQFSPRTADYRWYRYFEPAGEHRLARWRSAARLFQGEVDVRSLSHRFPEGASTVRKIDRVGVRRVGALFEVDVRAPSFVWGMVRKMVSALRGHDTGRFSLADIREMLAGHRTLPLPLAEPERLVLWEVGYSGDWEFTASSFTGHQLRARERERAEALVRPAVEAALWSPWTTK